MNTPKPDLKLAEEAFFAAMAVGYAQSKDESTIIQIPGSKIITHVHGDFQVTDVWLTTSESEMSEGFTTIAHLGTPVWFMHYGGHYEKEVIPFLKSSLHHSYVMQQEFCGGRGPKVFREPVPPGTNGLTYENQWIGGFEQFNGVERIRNQNGLSAGHHIFWGGTMLKNRGIPSAFVV